MDECSHCKAPLRGESGIRCRGVCGTIFHQNIRCCIINALEVNKFVKFMCDDCVIYIHNVDLVLLDIQEVNKNNLREYKYEFEMSLRNNESEIKSLLEAIEKRYEERMQKLQLVQ